jgi:prepilin-type N-terminal cleavage/methylation domain-containing protein
MKSSGIGSDRRKKGFTLMELLIVVAIIAILVAISIPVFAGQLERAKEATCLANRRSLKSLVTESWMSGGQAAVDSACKENQGLFNCPDGGTIDYYIDSETGVCTVVCSYHDKQDAAKKVTSKFVETTLGTDAILKGSRIDSTSAGGKKTNKINKEIQDRGFNLEKMGAKSWAIINASNNKGTGTDLVWSSFDISGVTYTYSSVPAIDYNYSSNSYSVGMAKVGTPNGYAENYKYNVLLPNKNSISDNVANELGNCKSFTTYAQALAYYNSLSPVKK